MEQLAGIRIPTTYNAALYMRLSKDDDLAGDSASIQNQRMILRKYAEENNMRIVGEYIDDGWSGTNFNRPGFQQMLEDLQEKSINCVITKDLSRLGRNYLEVGHYTETFFPANGIRYIAINDNVDTLSGDSDLAPFMNIFNEFHAKQTSKKIRLVNEMKFAEGACHYTYPPMGYIKDPEDKSHLIPDEKSRWIIEKIFDLADSGMGAYSIQKWLYQNKVITPGYREYVEYGGQAKTYADAPEDRKYQWGLANIKKILKDTVYIGCITHYKSRSISFKNKKRLKLPQEKWVVVENAHEPLIKKEQFDRVQRQIDARRRQTKDGEVQLFAGVAKCADCGASMRFSTNRQRKGAEYQYLSCGRRDEQLEKKCSLHYTRYDALQAIVLSRIQALYKQTEMDKTRLLKNLARINEEKESQILRKEKAEFRQLQQRKAELEKLFPRLYEDWVAGRISEQSFSMMSAHYEEEQKNIEGRMASLTKLVAFPSRDTEYAQKLIAEIERFSYPTELTHELIGALIEKIEIHEAVGPKGSRKKTQEIEIFWKFVGPVEARALL